MTKIKYYKDYTDETKKLELFFLVIENKMIN